MQKTNQSISLEKLLTGKQVTLAFGSDESQKYTINAVEPSPCTQACPAGVNVKAYVSLIAAGKFREALEVVRERNPLPGICGRICTHPCESSCNRLQVDDAVAVCWLKRFVADYESAHPQSKPQAIPHTRKEKIAVIGSGPAGLTTANDLVRAGFAVTIFEALPEPGGMLISGIPSFRLPRSILQTEIKAIERLGVKIKTNSPVKSLNQLLKKGFDAVFIAVGAHKGKKLGIPGEEKNSGIIDCVEFLREVEFGSAPDLGQKTIVIGGGNSAVDSARTALRLGCVEVNIVYRRSRKEMPANEAEIEEAELEGVKINYLAAPKNILGKNGRVTGMECLKMKLGKPDSSGRRRPVPVEGSEFTVMADTIIAAISQEPDLSFLGIDSDLEISRWNTFAVDEATLATSQPGIFAGGDAVSGPNTVIDAIAAGHIASRSIIRYLNGEPLTPEVTSKAPMETEIQIDFKSKKKKARSTMPMIDVKNRRNKFTEVELGFDQKTAIAEAQRCLRCGPCSECFICVPECDKITTMLASTDELGKSLFRLPAELGSINQLKTVQETVITAGKQRFPLELTPVVPYVNEALCRGCGDCVSICEYNAITLIPKTDEIAVSNITVDICRGCGTCVAVCPSSAIIPQYFTKNLIQHKLATIDPETPAIVVFSCNWNGAQMNGERDKYKDIDIINIDLMCSGGLEASMILEALNLGARGVLITGCSEDSCHYQFGARQARKTFKKVKQMAHMLGFDSDVIQFKQLPDKNSNSSINILDDFINAALNPESGQLEIIVK